MPTAKTPKDVYGDNIIADIADFFLIDEPSDVLNFLPSGMGGVGKGVGAVSRVMKEANSPSANAARKMFGGAKRELLDDFTLLFKRLGANVDDLARPIAKELPINPKNSGDLAEMMKRRITEGDKDSLLRTGVTAASLGEGTLDAARKPFDNLMKFIDDEIEGERQRTGGRGLF